MATFKTGAIAAASYLTENKSSWNHATNIGRLRYSFGRRTGIVWFPTGQAWWLMRNGGDSVRFIKQVDIEEDRIRLDIGGAVASDDAGADLSNDFETKGVIGIVANGQTYQYQLLSIDRSDKYNLVISANFQGAWQTFIENHILSRNPYRDARDVRDVEFVFWDGNGTNPFAAALPDAEAPAVGVNAIAAGNEETTVQVSATEQGGLYDGITRKWTAQKGTIVQDNDNPLLAQWTRPDVSMVTEAFNVTYSVDVTGDGTKAKSGTTDSASASHSATVNNVLNAATPPDTVIIDVVRLITEDAGHQVKLTATLSGGVYDSAQYQWRVKNNSYTPQIDQSDTALDGTDLTSPTLTYPAPHADVASGEIQVELSVITKGDGTLAEKDSTSVARSATPVTFTSWHPVALPDWATPTPLGILDRDDVHLASDQEGSTVSLYAIRKADTGRFDDVEVDWEWSHSVDDMNNRVWINLDDEVDNDPFIWVLPSVDVDTPIFVRARYKVLGKGTNARDGTETTWSAWRQLAFTILTFHVKAPTGVALSVTHNSGPDAGNADTVFEAGSTVRMAAVYDSDGVWDTRDVVWGYIHDDNAVINAATSIANTSAILTMPNPTEASGDWDIWLYLEVTYKGTGTNARSGSTVTRTYYIKDITVRYPRPDVVLPTTLQIAVGTTPGVPDGDEGTSVTVGLIVEGGKFDSYTQEWSVLLGSDNVWGEADDTETIDFTRPRVAADTEYIIACRVLFKGDGTIAKDGSEKVREVDTRTTVLNVALLGIHIAAIMASKIYQGGQLADKVYIGNVEIWSKS